MVNVDDKTSQIRLAVYGKDVRESLASGIEAIADEVNKFENNTNNKQTEYENKINKDLSEYKESLNQRQSDYETKINNEFVEYKIDMNAEWAEYKINIDNDENDRKNNENIRTTNENERIENEKLRIQNEIIRQNNEEYRINNEKDRIESFNGMQHIDANLELSTARGAFDTLNDRLNNAEGETLPNKLLINIKHDYNSYPLVQCICGYYGAGMGTIDSNNPAGLNSYSIINKVSYKDKNNIGVYVPDHYSIKSPSLTKIDKNKYMVTSEDSTEIKSILIILQEV